jgi:predicted enzyme related to lactoylglutathione lyase
MNEHGKINYVEFPARDIQATKVFFTKAFGWKFEDFGHEYTSFSDQGLDGGFFKSEQSLSPDSGGALVVFYSRDLEVTYEKIENSGGVISKPIFSFPGGRRFHFVEPSGNELAVWTDVSI